MVNEHDQEQEGISIYETLQQIKGGVLDPRLLSKSDRQLCVEFLKLEGHPVAGIASLMKKSDRTILRDIEEIRQKHAIGPSPELTKILVGEFIVVAGNQHSRLKQLARESNASIREKIQAEYLAYKVLDDLLDRLSSIGFLLPNHCQEDIADPKGVDKNLPEMSPNEKKIMETSLMLGPLERKTLADKIFKEIIKINEAVAEEDSKCTHAPPSDNKATIEPDFQI